MRRWVLTKEFKFEAAHHLPYHDGKCRRVHGHSWVGEVAVEGRFLQLSGPKQGMVVDYTDISAALNSLVDNYLDHHDLNETLPLESPTSEAIAQWLYQQLKTIPTSWIPISVTIRETCTSSCTYSESLTDK